MRHESHALHATGQADLSGAAEQLRAPTLCNIAQNAWSVNPGHGSADGAAVGPAVGDGVFSCRRWRAMASANVRALECGCGPTVVTSEDLRSAGSVPDASTTLPAGVVTSCTPMGRGSTRGPSCRQLGSVARGISSPDATSSGEAFARVFGRVVSTRDCANAAKLLTHNAHCQARIMPAGGRRGPLNQGVRQRRQVGGQVAN